jgi:hypothetical protein
MHEGEIFDVRHLSRIEPNANFQVGESNSAGLVSSPALR